MKKKNETLLLTNFAGDYDWFVKELIEEGIEENSNEMYERIDQEIESEIDSFWGNLKYSKYNNNKCVIVGSLGLWNGRRGIVPTVCESVSKAIEKCFDGNFEKYVTVKQVNGHLEVTVAHHDGTNYFSIHLLNEKGKATENGDLSNRRYHKAIKGFIF